MCDGIHIDYWLHDFAKWKNDIEYLGISFTIPIYTDSGEIKGRNHCGHSTYTHRAKWRGYDLRVLEIHKGNDVTYLLKINGSLHKSYFNGENYLRFTYEQMQEEIRFLCHSLAILPHAAHIVTLEIGVNLPLWFTVTPFIDNALLLHKTKAFVPYEERNGISLGLTARHAQYVVKCYDKGLQYKLPTPLLRLELRYLKMQRLKSYNIATLADLQQPRNVLPLIRLLSDCWNDILLNEPAIDIFKFPPNAFNYHVLILGRNRMEWVNMAKENPRKFKERRRQFRALVKKHGTDIQAQILKLIINEWNLLCAGCPNLPRVRDVQKIGKSKYGKGVTPKFTIKVKGKNGQPETRTCKSCGNDISLQAYNSIFCAAKYVGYDNAHRCRNRSSNPRNNAKRKLQKLVSQNLLFDVIPYLDMPA